MSASREKKNRRELSGTDWTNPKTAREAQQRREEKRSNMVYAAIAVIFVIVAVVSLTWKSQIIQRSTAALTINGEKYNAAEVNYYYKSLVSQNSYILSYLGVDTSGDLRDQEITDSTAALMGIDAGEGMTWFDYYMEQAIQQMMSIQALNDAAEADGFTWTDEMQAELDSSVESLKTNIASYGYTSLSQYLTANYGSSMTEKIFLEQAKRGTLAQAYADAYSDSLVYSEDELTAAYEADRNSYDKVAYESVRISGSVASTDDEGNEIEVTDEMKEEAMAQAKADADSIYAAFQSGESLSDLADANEDATYTESDGVSYGTDTLGTWLFDDARQPGDTAVLEDTSTSACFVVRFERRYRDDYKIANVRHILIQPEESELSEDDEGYEADVAAKKEAALQKAEELLAQWKAGEATEDSFAQLAMDNSADTGSAANGGLITDINKTSSYVESFRDWCFVDGRQAGDTGIVESTYGYHIMYYAEPGLPYWQSSVETALKNEAESAWMAEKVEGYAAEQQSGMRYVG